jgi:hypothetical protein
MRPEDYTDIKQAVEAAGCFTTLQPNGDGGVWIVLVSRCTEGRLHGNSVRVSLKRGHWYLVTWSPAYYLIPHEADLTAVCLDCLRVSTTPIPEVPPDVAGHHGLLRISEHEYDRP